MKIGNVEYCKEWKKKIKIEHKKQKMNSNHHLSQSKGQSKLSPNGYLLNVAVYYDDIFYKKIGKSSENKSAKRITAVMAIVDEMYSEKDSLTTEIDVEVLAIKHAKGYDWSKDHLPVVGGEDETMVSTCRKNRNCTADIITRNQQEEANLFVLLTAGDENTTAHGLAAEIGSVCDVKRSRRTTISTYIPSRSFLESEKGKDGDAYTAETIAHEMGHNLGMYHDHEYCGGTQRKRLLNGKPCVGYMDYDDDTNQWSHCSVADLTSYMNKVIRHQKKFCLKELTTQHQSRTQASWKALKNLLCYWIPFVCNLGSKGSTETLNTTVTNPKIYSTSKPPSRSMP